MRRGLARSAVAAAMMAACDRDHPREPSPSRAIEHRVTCGSATATWSGENDGHHDHWMALAFAIDGRPHPTTRQLELPDDMTFDIFSPDCERVLLLASRYGPFHVVRTRELAAYLEGAAPERELSGTPDPDGVTGTGVFRGGGWISSTEVGFTWGCCDPPITTRVVLPALR